MLNAELRITLRRPTERQSEFIYSPAKRRIIRAGRRSGKTTGIAILAVEQFLAGRRVLYATPTSEQIQKFWSEVRRALGDAIDANIYVKNETMHTIERPGLDARIKAKTAYNADTLRGDYCDLLILDEWQLMDEDAWATVGAPMLLDNNGAAIFIYTPPSLHSKSVTKARDPRHASKMFKSAQADTSGRWETFHFTSHDNPFISAEALQDIALDMSSLAIRQEIYAEDVTEVPGALWTLAMIEETRIPRLPEDIEFVRVVVGVDPPGGATECGIVVAALGANGHRYIWADFSVRGSPETWASRVLDAYETFEADRVVGEQNYGGDMVETTIRAAAEARRTSVSYRPVHATRGKAIRAEPQVAGYERGEIHHIGDLPLLEDEMISWVPGQSAQSPNRMDALVWALTELDSGGRVRAVIV